ncbi:MAG: tetratricopeptide repeat protein [Planctomycetaceae bacterium]|nr:tetratricopeptide repeat protein [Planctomycetaceae bacterium]
MPPSCFKLIAGCLLALTTSATRAGPILGDGLSPLLDAAPRTAGDAEQSARLNERLQRAVAAFEREDHDEAFWQFEAAHREFPELPPPRLLLARLFLTNGEAAATRALLERVAVDHADYPGTYITLGRLALLEGRLADAEAQFEKAAAVAGAGGAEFAEQYSPPILEGRAEVAERRGDFAAASSFLATLVSLNPKSAAVHLRLGCAQFRCGQREQAAESLATAISIEPSMPPIDLTMAELHMLAGESDAAGELLVSATERTPEDVRLQTALAGWLLKQDRVPEAGERAAAAVALDPVARDARFVLGVAKLHGGSPAEAAETFAELQQSAPADLESLRYLALALAHQEDQVSRNRALQCAESLARQLPENRLAGATLGWCQYRAGRLSDARQTLLRSIAGGQGPAETGYYLACVLRDLGETSEVPKLLESAAHAPKPFLYSQDVERWRSSAQSDDASVGAARETSN